jgi:hypothetical protein
MSFVIRGLAGPYINKYFAVGHGMTLGRRQGDILLELDSMVSSVHGKIVMKPTGWLCLQDLGSSNQFLVDSKKVAEVALVPGATFQVGQSAFEVLKVSDRELHTLTLEKSWKNTFLAALRINGGLPSAAAKALQPVVKVECLQGPSAENSWFLGFGPRLFGPLCEDIEILEKDSDDISFEVFQGREGPYVKARTERLLINNQALPEKRLEEGDEIRVGSSLFKFRLGQ